YYRLSVIQIDIPPLRERGDDVILLAEHFLEHFRERLRRKNIRGLAPEVKDAFRRYHWPGNVRELRNAIERAMILEEGDLITLRYLPGGIATEVTTSHTVTNPGPDNDIDSLFRLPPEGVSLDAVETSLVRQALALSKGNQGIAANLLRISRDRLRYRMLKIQGKGEA
ncbi:MAG TPA: helix-turn-helix domain-containing protein, partial [Blastocatellia bacterium]|nr:helix-turn-helix domain-containing protein [Blastocatellia bacterium]